MRRGRVNRLGANRYVIMQCCGYLMTARPFNRAPLCGDKNKEISIQIGACKRGKLRPWLEDGKFPNSRRAGRKGDWPPSWLHPHLGTIPSCYTYREKAIYIYVSALAPTFEQSFYIFGLIIASPPAPAQP